MKKPAVHQFTVGATPGDAITEHAFLLHRWLREAGIESEIYAESIHPSLAGEVLPYGGYRPSRPGELVVLHHSIGADVVEALLDQDVRFLVIYHNVTPPSFLQSLDPRLTAQLRRGRDQLRRMRERTVLALGVSAYNQAELKQVGFARTGILPIVMDPALFDLAPDPDLFARCRDGGPNLLFVGRLVPNKRQEDLIKLLFFCKRIQSTARLFLVGAPWVSAYAEWLQELAEELDLAEAAIFAGHVSQRHLVTYYRLADVYVSMSEHEGFGKPLIESMYLGVPVMAYAAAAVPETMGGAGVLFHAKDYEVLAELVDMVVNDEDLRRHIVERQRRRAQTFLEPVVRQVWQRFLTLALAE